MSRISSRTLAVAVIAAGIGFGSAVSYQAIATTGVTHEAPESHTHMRHALEALHTAKEALEHADRDYHGRRVKAIEATTSAIEHVEAALKE